MSCYNSVVANAPVDKVWSTLANFHDLSWAPEVVTSVTRVGDVPGTDPGAKRILNDLFHETLVSVDPEAYTFSYSIDDGPDVVSKDAVSNYVGTVRLLPVTVDNQTVVVWTSEYESADPNAVAEFCNPIYHALLVSLQAHFAQS